MSPISFPYDIRATGVCRLSHCGFCCDRILLFVTVSLKYSPSIPVGACYQGTRWPLHGLRHRLGKQSATTLAWIMWPSLRLRFMFTLQVAAYNSEGKSNPSQVVEFITNPDKPGSPCRPVIRGRVLPNSFRMTWGEQGLTCPQTPPPNPSHFLHLLNKLKKSYKAPIIFFLSSSLFRIKTK